MFKKISRLLLSLSLIFVCTLFSGCLKIRDEDPELSQTQIEFNSLISKIATLETLSYNFNSNDYQNRVFVYIRSEKYNTTSWNTIGGSIEQEFNDYIETNQSETDISSLKTFDKFTIPNTEEKVDFVHMFATMNAINKNPTNTNAGDLAGWAGDLCQLALEVKNTNQPNKISENVNSKFNNFDSGFNKYDLVADLDAVNIMKIYNDMQTKSISKAIENYYKNITVKSRKTNFLTNLGYEKLNKEQIKANIFNRLRNNFFITIWSMQNNLDFESDQNIILECINVFVNFLI